MDDNARHYPSFFQAVMGDPPYPYQENLGVEAWPDLLDVPTGLGKTAAILVAWLWKRLQGEAGTPRRLVYCLPMRVLVEQTVRVAEDSCERAAESFRTRGLAVPTVHPMLGGFVDERWEESPDAPAILVGTQDMLLSRALGRGYAMSRYKWPIHFGLLHNDCLWVLDETQLMGVAVETSAQLEGLRRSLGMLGPTRSVWMSATLSRAQLTTIDHPEPPEGYRVLALGAADREAPAVKERTGAKKPLDRADVMQSKKNLDDYVEAVAALAAAAHAERGDLTLVILNRVGRAQDVYRALCARDVEPLALVHSRFRAVDRTDHERLLTREGPRVVVATQAVEAGVDVSARTLITELAPWPSLVQRFGRCNRYGTDHDARAMWLDLDVEADEDLARPYSSAELSEARHLLESLDDAGPERLARVAYTPPRIVRPILRRRDLLDLFDTTPDLLGNDVDVSRFVRDGSDTDVVVFYRIFDGDPNPEMTAPDRGELVRVPIGSVTSFIERLRKKRQSLGNSERDRERKRWLTPWSLSHLGTKTPWTYAATTHPGQVVLLHAAAGGYDQEVGWTGEVLSKHPVVPATTQTEAPVVGDEMMGSDARTTVGRWLTLLQHLSDAAREAENLVATLNLPDELQTAVTTAALWHDVGKAHAEFQRRLVEPVRDDPALAPSGDGPWAKSTHRKRPPQDARPYFRHELASALAWLQLRPAEPHTDLVAYLIAAHHGKVRLSIRSVPGERRPPEPGRLFARGIWHGDLLPAVELTDGTVFGPVELDLSPMQLGEGSWLERTLILRDDPVLGPFRLAFLEAIVRIADWRASEEERRDA